MNRTILWSKTCRRAKPQRLPRRDVADDWFLADGVLTGSVIETIAIR